MVETSPSRSEVFLWSFVTNLIFSGNAYYHSVQNLSSSCLLSRNIKIWIYKTIILPVVLYGCETWYLTLKEEHILEGVWEQGAEENIWTEERWSDRRLKKKRHNEELHNLYFSPKYNWNDQVSEDQMRMARSTNGDEEECIYYIGYWWESQKERDH
jgi:hypothetical protein